MILIGAAADLIEPRRDLIGAAADLIEPRPDLIGAAADLVEPRPDLIEPAPSWTRCSSPSHHVTKNRCPGPFAESPSRGRCYFGINHTMAATTSSTT